MGKKTRRNKPADPAEAARIAYERRIDPAKWGTNDAALSLPANGSVREEAETRTKTRRVHRYDGFALLLSRNAISEPQEAAVRRLEDLVAIHLRVDRASASDERVDRSASPAPPVSDDSIEAANDIKAIGAHVGGHSMKLLLAILEPQCRSGQPVNWRAHVEASTGERYPHGQVALVRAACENLRLAWIVWDNRKRRAA